MDKPDLLAEFEGQLEAFDTYQSRMTKAREMAGKFRPEVVEKVVREQIEKTQGVAARLDPLVIEMQGVIDALQNDRAAVEERTEAARLGLEELELRKEIGELDDAAFAEEASAFQGDIGAAEEQVAKIDDELDAFRTTLQRWLDRRPAAETEDPSGDDDLLGDLEDEQEAAGLDDDEPPDAFADDDDDDSAFADDDGRGEAVHASKVEIADDVSAVFASEDETVEPAATPTLAVVATASAVVHDDEEVIEAGEASSEEGISFGDDDLGDMGQDLLARSPITVDATGAAVLILGEGTEEEAVFSFQGDIISLGRGRDNTVQVKNDSKVSRNHCKLFERDGGFFIEDNKSANGTLVDGELITEKRLLGGEEIIIGETFFRFRIHP